MMQLISLPLRPASLMHKNPQWSKIICGMRARRRKYQLINLQMFLKNISFVQFLWLLFNNTNFFLVFVVLDDKMSVSLQLHADLSVYPKFWGHRVFIYSGYCSCHCWIVLPKNPRAEFLWFRWISLFCFKCCCLIDFLIPIVTWWVLHFSIKYWDLPVKFVAVCGNAFKSFKCGGELWLQENIFCHAPYFKVNKPDKFEVD